MSDQSGEVCAVVVTRDRRALLEQCLDALAAQTVAPAAIVLVDNASSDGTAEWIRTARPTIDLVALRENVGGAGGFHTGMERALRHGTRWLWLLDDDTIPRPDALERLLAGAARAPRDPMLLASKVLWSDGSLHPMNRPGPHWRRVDVVAEAVRAGLLPLRYTTFVSLLVNRAATELAGLPQRHYFIWSDDLEYTARITRTAAAYLVPESVVEHRTAAPYTAIEGSGDRFYYHVRNTLLMVRGSSWDALDRARLLYWLCSSVRDYMRRNGWSRGAAAVVLRGAAHGLRDATR